MNKKRIIYAVAFLILLIIEILIGVSVQDSFVRPYLGDVLVVILLYCLIRIIIPKRCRLLPLYLFMFAAGVEFFQGLNIADRLGIQSRILRTIIGTVCDIQDIYCYAAGCILIGVYEMGLYLCKKRKMKKTF